MLYQPIKSAWIIIPTIKDTNSVLKNTKIRQPSNIVARISVQYVVQISSLEHRALLYLNARKTVSRTHLSKNNLSSPHIHNVCRVNICNNRLDTSVIYSS